MIVRLQGKGANPDALGAVGKPIHRVHTAGSVGASTAISACHVSGTASITVSGCQGLRMYW